VPLLSLIPILIKSVNLSIAAIGESEKLRVEVVVTEKMMEILGLSEK
jgi:hypothetical protein